jgi:hypothetical protein
MKSRPIRQSIIFMGIFLIIITFIFAYIKTLENHNIKEGYLSTRLTVSIQDILDSDLEDAGKIMKLEGLELPEQDGKEYKKILKSSNTPLIKLKKIKELLDKENEDKKKDTMEKKIKDAKESKESNNEDDNE